MPSPSRKGRSLATNVDIRGNPVREAVAILSQGVISRNIKREFLDVFCIDPLVTQNIEVFSLRFAWNVVSIYLCAHLDSHFQANQDIKETIIWFCQKSKKEATILATQYSSSCLRKAEECLKRIKFDSEFRFLLPYILEEHGPGSRASVLKNPTTSISRKAKREAGVFYTPVDVADYMVRHTRKLYKGNFSSAKCIDPACGTGVFFLAIIRSFLYDDQVREDFSKFIYITNHLFGMDVSGHALDAAAFLLLQECISEVIAIGITPLHAWRLIRSNLVQVNSLLVESRRFGRCKQSKDEKKKHSIMLDDLFTGICGGFDVLIGNPPYASLGECLDFDSLKNRFSSLRYTKASSRLNLFPFFIEMMWLLTKNKINSAALVVPLSISYHSGAQIKYCRHSMVKSGGRWQFAFFDREPNALFGEEVKTRNAILFHQKNPETPPFGKAAIIETGPLQKWTSRSRRRLFENIRFTSIDSFEIYSRIPKLEGKLQVEAFRLILNGFNNFLVFPKHFGSCKTNMVFSQHNPNVIFVGGTAYNFLNVYRPTKLLKSEKIHILSESPVHYMEFKTESEANIAFAILCSRLVFWLWHVLGDGFHVSRWLFNYVPFNLNSLACNDQKALLSLGKSLWNKVQKHRFVSLNSKRLSIGFRPLFCQNELDEIDSILIRTSGIKKEFLSELQSFIKRVAVVDLTDKYRKRINDIYNNGASNE